MPRSVRAHTRRRRGGVPSAPRIGRPHPRAALPLAATVLALGAPGDLTAAAEVGRPAVRVQSVAEEAGRQQASDERSMREQAGKVASMLELAATEYVDAVADGRVTDAAEYEETVEFTRQAARMFTALAATSGGGGVEGEGASDAAGRVAAGIDSLQRIVRDLGPPEEFEALVGRLGGTLAEEWGAVAARLPGRPPSAAAGAVLYRRHCASCHGASGAGDGPAAAGMEPPPADLAADVRHLEATPARDFQVVSYGIPATAMAGWSETLSLEERWDVVAYLQGLRFAGSEVAEGRDLALGGLAPAAAGDADGPVPADGAAADDPDGATIPREIAGALRTWSDLEAAAGLADAELADRVRGAWKDAGARPLTGAQADAVVAYLRSRLGSGDGAVPEPDAAAEAERQLAAADSLVAVAAAASAGGDVEAARAAAIEAYMAFERVEADLRARAPGAVSSVERAFSTFRGALGTDRLPAARTRLAAELERAEDAFDAARSAWAIGTQSFFIILREGFEAILIIGAIVAFLVKTGHGGHRRTVYGGVAAAIVASFATAILLEGLFRAVPARQEVLEGAAMLSAVVVLFWVSCWLISKLDHARWERYLRARMQTAIGAGGGIALASVSFLAVYREGFETVLFYKALLGFADGMMAPVAVGFLIGCAALGVIYLLFTRYGIRIPLRPFFAGTSAVLYYMAIVFAGSGIHELQEAGVVGLTPVAGVPEIPLLGLHPTVETLAAQGVLVLLLAGALVYTFAPRRGRQRSPADGRGAGLDGGARSASAPVRDADAGARVRPDGRRSEVVTEG